MLKEIFGFKESFWLSTFAWLFVVIIIAMFAGEISDNREMKEKHCVQTEKTRVVEYTQTTLVGKVIIPQQRERTEHLYTCDDGNRWR